MGYGKPGSVEGFCSGGGIARLAEQHLRMSGRGASPWFAPGKPLTTKHLAEAARAGEPLALEVMTEAGSRLGDALAILVDLFNPERIVLGGFFPLCRDLLEPAMKRTLEHEALPIPRAACRILPAELGETIGSHGAVAAALQRFTPRQGTAAA
jgi:glucokinase